MVIGFNWKRNTEFIQKLREVFQWRETALRTHGTKSYEKLFFCQNYVIFEKNGTCCDWKVFFLISKVIWRFFLSLTVPLIQVKYISNHIAFAMQFCLKPSVRMKWKIMFAANYAEDCLKPWSWSHYINHAQLIKVTNVFGNSFSRIKWEFGIKDMKITL